MKSFAVKNDKMDYNFSAFTKEQVLIALWMVAKDAPFFEMEGIVNKEAADYEKAREKLSKSLFVDDFCGRLIKTKFDDLSKINALLFDATHGKGAVQRALNILTNKNTLQEHISYS